jgi:hypothetical protein
MAKKILSGHSRFFTRFRRRLADPEAGGASMPACGKPACGRGVFPWPGWSRPAQVRDASKDSARCHDHRPLTRQFLHRGALAPAALSCPAPARASAWGVTAPVHLRPMCGRSPGCAGLRHCHAAASRRHRVGLLPRFPFRVSRTAIRHALTNLSKLYPMSFLVSRGWAIFFLKFFSGRPRRPPLWPWHWRPISVCAALLRPPSHSIHRPDDNGPPTSPLLQRVLLQRMNRPILSAAVPPARERLRRSRRVGLDGWSCVPHDSTPGPVPPLGRAGDRSMVWDVEDGFCVFRPASTAWSRGHEGRRARRRGASFRRRIMPQGREVP